MSNSDYIGSTTSHPLYQSWVSMIYRCTNKKAGNYNNYGGRGIAVCSRWDNFWSFVDDMGCRPEGMTIDRIDNNKGYYPENCKWSTRHQQQANRRNSSPLGITGVTFKERDGIYRSVLTVSNIVYETTSKDFFEACCFRKSLEIRLLRYDL